MATGLSQGLSKVDDSGGSRGSGLRQVTIGGVTLGASVPGVRGTVVSGSRLVCSGLVGSDVELMFLAALVAN